MLFCNRNPVEISPFKLPGDASMIELASTPSKRTAFSWFARPLNRMLSKLIPCRPSGRPGRGDIVAKLGGH